MVLIIAFGVASANNKFNDITVRRRPTEAPSRRVDKMEDGTA